MQVSHLHLEVCGLLEVDTFFSTHNNMEIGKLGV